MKDGEPVRALVVEDTGTVRRLLVEILGAGDGIEVVGVAHDGEDAVQAVRRLRPDVVTMDIRMPRLDGFSATRRIMSETPVPIVVVSAMLDPQDQAHVMQALRAGALTVLPVPRAPGTSDFETDARRLRETVKAMAGVRVVHRWRAARPVEVPERPPRNTTERTRLVAVVASTGGPGALQAVLGALPAEFPVPVMVVQHIARGFVQGLVEFLLGSVAMEVRLARQGEPLRSRTVYVAPDDSHLCVGRNGTVHLSSEGPVDGFRPSGTALFRSAARVFGASAAAVVLTGMGRDGVEGLEDLRGAGGRVVAQDAATSVVHGIPGAAIVAGLVDEVLPLERIAPRLVDWTGGPQRNGGKVER